MANPQLEDGHLRIANDIWEALCRIRIPGEVRQIIDTVLRKTWGFRKKEDWISLSQFHVATGISKPHIVRALSRATTMNIITKKGKAVAQKGNVKLVTYSFNKDYESWKSLPKKVTVVAQKGKASLPKKVTVVALLGTTKDILKDNTTKDNITKDINVDKDKIPYPEIISDLNEVAGTNYSHKAESHREKIRARWKEGYRLEQFKTVHRKKHRQWVGSDMAKFLRPATLYAKSHFDDYLNEPESLIPILSKAGVETMKAMEIWEQKRRNEEARREEVQRIDNPTD